MGRRALRPGEIGAITWERRPGGVLRGVARTRTGGGEMVRLSSTLPTKAEMEADLRRRAAELAYVAEEWSPRTELSRVIDAWLEDRAEEERGRPQTLAGYRRVADACVVPRLGAIACEDVTAPMVRELMRSLKTVRRPDGKAGYAASYRRHALIVIRGALDHAVRLGLIAANAAAAEPMPQAAPPKAHPLTPDQVEALREAVRRWETGESAAHRLGPRRLPVLRWAVELGLATGARIGEVLAFQIGGVADVPAYSIAVDGTIIEAAGGAIRQRKLKGADKERRLLLPEWVRSTVDVAIEVAPSREPDATILQTATGRPLTPSYIQTRIRSMRTENRDLLDKAGIKAFTFHDLRATVLKAVTDSTGLETARAQAGHSRSITTQGYLGARDALPVVEGSVAAIERAFEGKAAS